MRCPSCNDEFEPHVTWCASCHVELVPEGAPAPPRPPGVPDARLGRFHPAVGQALLELLDDRGIPFETVTGSDALEIVVPREERDELRAELALHWGDRLEALDEQEASDVRWAAGGHYPGWFDPPEGGFIDRQGRLVVDAAEDAEADAARRVGPTLAIGGASLLLLAWYLGLGMGTVFAGVGLLIIGVLLPR